MDTETVEVMSKKTSEEKARFAAEAFLGTYTCTQGMLLAYAEEIPGLDKETAMRIGNIFGSGLSHTGDTCGIAVAALMIIAMKYGQTNVDDKRAKDMTYMLGQDFLEAFKERHPSIVCREMLNCDLGTEEGRAYDYEHSISYGICPTFLKDAIEILDEILEF